MAREFEELYLRYKDRLYTYALGIVSRASWAEDIVQDTFEEFLKKYHTLRINGAARRFLYACVHNRAVDYLRRKQNGHAHLPDDDVLAAADGNGLHEDDRDRVRESLKTLSPDQREIVFLKAYEEMTLEEIASVLDKPLGTVAAQYHRALARLRAVLDPVREKQP